MKKKLTAKSLMKKYPKLFAQHNKPMTETCMCWGVEHGDGWLPLLDALCSHLQFDIDENSYPQIEFSQIKEKYGTARWYYSYAKSKDEDASDNLSEAREQGKQDGMISFAEYLTGFICEECGSNKDVSQTGHGWIKTLCKECEAKLASK